VVAGYPNGKLIALDIEDGKPHLGGDGRQPARRHRARAHRRRRGPAGVDGSNVCAAAFQAKVACFEIASRNQLWSRDSLDRARLAVDTR
jgi:outer membrane protein assembly factor BamB